MFFLRVKQVSCVAAMGLTAFFCNVSRAEPVGPDGLIRVRSSYSVEDSIARMRQDIAAKGILFFQAVDQAPLAGGQPQPVDAGNQRPDIEGGGSKRRQPPQTDPGVPHRQSGFGPGLAGAAARLPG